ncbi:methyl-accepting chemotaxis protein [Roseibium limicola]|nr:methyl-accepting chemotaxis protein [Roseibium limicola]
MLSIALHSVSAKILYLVALVSLATVCVAAIGVGQMSKIGHELASITENNIPLTKTVNTVTSHQLEQQVLLEKMLRTANIHLENEAAQLHSLEQQIEKLTLRVEDELKESEQLTRAALAHAETDYDRSKFSAFLDEILVIEGEYAIFEEHIFSIIKAIDANEMEEATRLAQLIEEEEARLDSELVQLQSALDIFTLEAARLAVEHEQTGIRRMVIIAIVSVLLGATLAVLFANWRIARPLKAVTAALISLTRGDTSVSVTVTNKDEIGALAKAFETFKTTMIEIERLRLEAIEEEKRIETEKRDATLRLADNLEGTVKAVSDSIALAIRDLEETAQSMAATATQTSERSNAVASAAHQSATGIQSVAGASEELFSSIQEISRQVTDAMSVVAQTSSQAADSSRNVENLTQAASKIDEVVNLINDIAGQTNLLALNATIEAARAGESGKGFAVVAAEVKELATQTAKATDDIRSQVEALQHGSSETRQAITDVVGAILRMKDQIGSIAAAVEEQSAVTNEIARNVNEVATGSEDISMNINDVSLAATSASASAEELRATIGSLSGQSSMLQSELDGFLLNIRAA